MIKRYDLKNENIGRRLSGYAKVTNGVCDWYLLRGEGDLLSVAMMPKTGDAVGFKNSFLYTSAPLIISPQTRVLSAGPERFTACQELIDFLQEHDPVHAYFATKPKAENGHLPSLLTFSYLPPPSDLYNAGREMIVQDMHRARVAGTGQ